MAAFELGHNLGALAAIETAAGTEFVDVVSKRDHRPLLLYEDRRAHRAERSGLRIASATGGTAERGEPIFSAHYKTCALSRTS